MITHFESNILQSFYEIDKKSRDNISLPNKKAIIEVVLGIIKSRSALINEIAQQLNQEVLIESNQKRITRLLNRLKLDDNFLIIWVLSLIGKQKFKVCIDRTNWKNGQQNINLLVLTVYFKGLGLPLLFSCLDKKGNSNQKERLDLIRRLITFIDHKSIECIYADREFIGRKWLKWLHHNRVRFIVRIHKSHDVIYQGQYIKAGAFTDGTYLIEYQDLKLNLTVKVANDPVLLVGLGYNMLKRYKERWSIETSFQAMKGRGFRLESSEITDLNRFLVLFTLICLALIWCAIVGIWCDEEKPIAIAKHGYKYKSYFRSGLDIFRNAFRKTRQKRKSIRQILNFFTVKICLFCNNVKTVP